MNQSFWTCSWMNGDPLKDSLLPPPCGATMKLHWLRPVKNTQVKYQQKKYLVSQIRGSELTVIYMLTID